MKCKSLQIGIWLQWVVLPIVALQYASVWNQLPDRMATHFNAAGQPNGWMTPESSFRFVLILLAFVLGVFNLVVYAARKSGTTAIAWALLAFSYCVAAFIATANQAVINYNLSGQPIHLSAFVMVVPVAVVILIAAVLASHRGSELPAGKLIAEEVHGSHLWGGLFLVLAIVALAVLTKTDPAPVRVPFAILAVVFLAVGMAAWFGFRYSFTQSGVVIRALGFRLKSIPVQQIQRYAIDRWNAIRGYGIRGVGNSRAYVWGNKGLWITTANERVFLGHSEPERLVRDMDRMMKVAKT
jgi:Protein of unknown function (DUF1648)